MPNNDIKNTIHPKNKISYDDIKKIVEDEPNYTIENNNITRPKKLVNHILKKVIDYSHFKIN